MEEPKQEIKLQKKTKAKRYKKEPDVIRLEDFLASYIAEQEKEAEADMEERALKQAYREHKREFNENKELTYALPKKKENTNKAYVVTFGEKNPLVYIAFVKTREKALYAAVKHFQELGLMEGFDSLVKGEEYMHRSARRLQDLDKYGEEGKVPIPVLLKSGFEFPCTACGKGSFKYSDYEEKKCFVVEEGVDLAPYAIGVILCGDCYNRLIGDTDEECSGSS